MTEADWLNNSDPQAMLTFLQDNGKLSDRRARLFAAACCRRIWPHVQERQSRKRVEVSELYADGPVTRWHLERDWLGLDVDARLIHRSSWSDLKEVMIRS